MKPLPMIPPEGQTPPEQTAPLQTAGMTPDPERTAALKPAILKALSSVYDPEIPVNICELGLIYDVIVDASSAVGIRMTLTAPACPAAQSLPQQVKEKAAAVPGVTDVTVDVVWEPPWDKDRMSEAARLQLGMF